MAVGKGSIRRASSANSAVKEKKEVQAVPEQKPAQEKERTYEVVSAIKSDLPVHLL